MANDVKIVTLFDAARHFAVQVSGILDSSDVSLATLVDVSAMASMFDNGTGANAVTVDRIEFATEGVLAVELLWDASTDVQFASLVGQGVLDYSKVGGLRNNSGAGKTGDINYRTAGHSGTMSFSLTLFGRKQGV